MIMYTCGLSPNRLTSCAGTVRFNVRNIICEPVVDVRFLGYTMRGDEEIHMVVGRDQ
jgi:hypothetical protein